MDSSAISLHPPRRHWKYDVFLSFRGEDTRNNFTDHLFSALVRKGIVAFRDDESLGKGEAIRPELLKAIEDSMSSIVVFSKNYASSGWCLDELAKIIECMDTMEQHVLPVFYNVDPSHVRKQAGQFAKDFAEHEKNPQQNAEKVKKWRGAMTAAANLTGWDVRDRSETQIVDEIVEVIFARSNRIWWSAPEGLVGICSRLVKLETLLDKGSDNVHIIGIYGIGGIGKTTIARVIFDNSSDQFDASCFLANVREVSEERDGLVRLQRQLLYDLLGEKKIRIWNTQEGIKIIRSRACHKRALVILDDANELGQLEALAGEKNWFGSGSRIIITTRDRHLLAAHRVDEFYSMEGLNYEESLKLFCLKAFNIPHPREGFQELSKKFLAYANGLPLALKVLGSFLCDKSVEEWISAVRGELEVFGGEILDSLEISYRGLNENAKQIFLDVAFLFKGMERRYATKVLENCGFCAEIGIRVLIDKSLITIVGENILWMHDLLQEMAHNVVRKEFPREPGKRSRLWRDEDVNDMLRKNTATDAVEVINYDGFKDKLEEVRPDAFVKMDRLRLLSIQNMQLLYGLHFLSKELRLLKWHAYPWKCLPSSFQPDEIVALEMPCSHIQQLWSGSRIMDKLTFVNLSHSPFLKRIPNLTGAPNLEELILEGCTNLIEVHPSIGLLKHLHTLNMKGCRCLWKLPDSIEMKSLRVFNLSGCSKLKKFPRISGKMHNLSKLFLDGTAIDKLPEDLGDLVGLEVLSAGGTAIEQLSPSIVHLNRLVEINLNSCKNLNSLPDSFCGLKSLKALRVYGCQKLDKLPESLGCLHSMEELDLGETAIMRLPPFILLMKNLRSLSLRGWGRQPSRSSIGLLNFFFPKKHSDSMSLCLPQPLGLSSLTKLDLTNVNLREGTISSEISCLSSLEKLHLSGSNVVTLPEDISRLSKLEELVLASCKQLKYLPELPSSIHCLQAEDCTSLETIPIPLGLGQLAAFNLSNCHRLVDSSRGSNLALTWLRAHLQLQGFSRKQFHIVLPGSEIPEWFKYQSMGSSAGIDIPPQLSNDSTFFGFAICAVFIFHHSLSLASTSGLGCTNDIIRSDHITPGLRFSFRFKDRPCRKWGIPHGLVNRRCKIGSDHLWLFYLSPRDPALDFSGIFGEEKIEFSFQQHELSPWIVDIKKCGAHLVYNQDVEKLDETIMQGGISGGTVVFEDLEEDYNHCSEEVAGREILVTKRRSRGEAIYDAAESTGSSCSRLTEEEPQPKRLKEQR